MSWKLTEIAQAVGGQVVGGSNDSQVTGIHFDSRKLSEGDLFVPLIANRNGHDFAESALDQGASASFWSQDPQKAPEGLPLILVSDTYQALVDFAKWYLSQVNPIKVAITGSNGKTTTKDMVAAVLSQVYQTHKTEANLNNEIGVPMTILTMPKTTQAIVVEMGMDRPGQIADLSKMVQPDFAIITMIGESHIEFFGSREKIAQAKLEIIQGLDKEGHFIANGDEPLLEPGTTKVANSHTFGVGSDNDLYATEIETGKNQTSFKINTDDTIQFTIPTPGKYNVSNALSAILLAGLLDMDINQAAKGLSTFKLSKNRLEWRKGYKQSSILNDAYNASPSSMKAVLDYFNNLETDGDKLAVLGDIRELGALSKDLHTSLAKAIDPQKIDRLILFGPEMQALYQALQGNFDQTNLTHFESDKAALIDYLKSIVKEKDTLLIKSSLGTGLLEVVEALAQD